MGKSIVIPQVTFAEDYPDLREIAESIEQE